ncbi:MAG: sterol desaturase family protein [Rhodospirillales bacterium]|nr:sterol desaturase family protein [Rhodospirillales bacterium]
MSTPAGPLSLPMTILSYSAWPLTMIVGLVGTAFAMASDHPLLWFNALYLAVALALGGLERVLPHERRWLANDSQTLVDLAHTLLNKGAVQLATAVALTLTVVATRVVEPSSVAPFALWPSQWPMFAQVALALVVAELGLYAAHRLAHEWGLMWRFHALHHSVTRLWFVNTGRFHVVDTFVKIALSQSLLWLLGAPLPVYVWFAAVTAFVGVLTHCNVDMRTGPLDLVFNTPNLHRWHHSTDPAEGNRNYGENLVLWDHLFGTYFNPPRRPPAEIGIKGEIAQGFLGQIAQPFTARGVREILGET